ncbi:MAG: OmpH family outer membrane protein [Bacteroidaceae bacterium]|nr:OmpH family outer membrane protein [Bacteroidaceae bacterium]
MKYIYSFLIFTATALMAACNGQQTNSTNANSNDSTSTQGVTFAYVDMDTLQAKYQYYLDCRSELETAYNGYQATLAKKESSLQSKVADFQKKAQEGRFVSEVEFNNAQAALAKEQATLEQLSQKYMQLYAEKEMSMNKAINDSIQNYLTEYNATHQFTMIFYKAVIMHCDTSLNITNEIVEGLNQRYNKAN